MFLMGCKLSLLNIKTFLRLINVLTLIKSIVTQVSVEVVGEVQVHLYTVLGLVFECDLNISPK